MAQKSDHGWQRNKRRSFGAKTRRAALNSKSLFYTSLHQFLLYHDAQITAGIGLSVAFKRSICRAGPIADDEDIGRFVRFIGIASGEKGELFLVVYTFLCSTYFPSNNIIFLSSISP